MGSFTLKPQSDTKIFETLKFHRKKEIFQAWLDIFLKKDFFCA